MVTGHRLVDGLIQEYWGLFIKWDTAMYQVGTECFVPRSFHSHVSLKVGGIWWFAMDPWISTSFHRVSTEIPMDFHIRIRNSCFSFSHQPGELRKYPWYDCPLYKARAIVEPYPALSSCRWFRRCYRFPCFSCIFDHFLQSYDVIWSKKNIESPGFRNWDPFFQTATAVPRSFSRCQLEKACCRPLDTVPTLRGTWLTWWTYYMYIIYMYKYYKDIIYGMLLHKWCISSYFDKYIYTYIYGGKSK